MQYVLRYTLTLNADVAVYVSHAVKNSTLINFNTIYKMQQILWETADNEISVQKCDVYLATALKKVNNRSILNIPFCFGAWWDFPTKIVLLVWCSIYIKGYCFLKLNCNDKIFVYFLPFD